MMWIEFECGCRLYLKSQGRVNTFFGSPGLFDAWMNGKLFFLFFCSEPRRCSGRRVACEDIEGLQPTRLPLQVTRMTWIIETSVSPPFGNNAVTISRKLAAGRVRVAAATGLSECARVLAPFF